jgi:hypothetical protein
MNVKHKEVGLQPNVKLILSKVSGMFSGTPSDVVSRALAVLNRVAGEDTNIGFRNKITGKGTLLGSVVVIDLSIPLGSRKINSSDELQFNQRVAMALNREFGNLASVGYLDPNPTRTSTVKVAVETESMYPETEVRNALRNVGTVTIL